MKRIVSLICLCLCCALIVCVMSACEIHFDYPDGGNGDRTEEILPDGSDSDLGEDDGDGETPKPDGSDSEDSGQDEGSAEKFLITVRASEDSCGVVNGNGIYYEGDTVAIVAEAKLGYSFTGWYVDGVRVSSSAEYTFTMPGYNVTYTANFTVSDDYSGFEFERKADGSIVITKFTGKFTDVVIPDGVSEIADRAFYNTGVSIESVQFGSGLKRIGKEAFSGCNSLKEISALDGLSIIEENAFYGCGIEYAEIRNVDEIGAYAFSYCYKLRRVTLENIGRIGEAAFSDDSSLANVDMIGRIDYIGEDAFLTYACVIVGMHIEDVSEWCGITFANAAANPLYGGGELYIGGEAAVNVVIPSTVTNIGAYAFISDSVESVTVHKDVEYIDDAAFDGVSGLIVYYEGSAEDWLAIAPMSVATETYCYSETQPQSDGDYWRYVGGVPMPWKWGGEKTFVFETNGGTQLPNVTTVALTSLPEPEKDGYYFAGWYNTADYSGGSVTLPYYDGEHTTLYAKWVERGGQSEGLATENGVITGIGSCADSVLVLNMPVGVGAFGDLSGVRKVIIGSGVTEIGDSAFFGASKTHDGLTTVVFESAQPPTLGTNIFGMTWDRDEFTLYVPDGGYDDYAAAGDRYWQQYIVSEGRIVEY